MLALSVLLESLKVPGPLRDRIAELLRSLSVEFHNDLFALLRQFRAADLERFAALWSKVDPQMRSAFVAFVVMGDDPDGRFLRYLDEHEDCQEAVDLAFAAHIDSLQDLGKSLSRAGQAVSENKAKEIATLLQETEKADEALETLESITSEATQPVRDKVQAARSAVNETKRGLRRVLAGIDG
jgi:hypothetical protein